MLADRCHGASVSRTGGWEALLHRRPSGPSSPRRGQVCRGSSGVCGALEMPFGAEVVTGSGPADSGLRNPEGSGGERLVLPSVFTHEAPGL